jgi:hypothetical protein
VTSLQPMGGDDLLEPQEPGGSQPLVPRGY